jgi:hypothetical protein
LIAWTFIAISNNQTKEQLREIIEKEETINYQRA